MSGLPLEGMRVLDLSRLLPGGFCSLLLADFGADVLKVEDTGMGDYIRWSPPLLRGRGGEREVGAVPRRSTATSARSASTSRPSAGARCCCGSSREHDVVLESFRPGVLDRLGVGYERMREENPRHRLLRDLRLRPGRPQARRSGPRHELPRR